MTTDSMVEKMARAIETAMPDYLAREIENRGLYAEIARAALEAMREPTEGMKYAGGTKLENMMFAGDVVQRFDTRVFWRLAAHTVLPSRGAVLMSCQVMGWLGLETTRSDHRSDSAGNPCCLASIAPSTRGERAR